MKRCRAFTLIELLIVVAILAVLAALSVSILLGVQEAMHRAQCVQNLHEIGTALHAYHDVHGVFPNESWPRTRETLVFVLLLPFIEQGIQVGDLDNANHIALLTCDSRRNHRAGPKNDYAGAQHCFGTPATGHYSILGGAHGLWNGDYPGTSLALVAERDGTSTTGLMGHKFVKPADYYFGNDIQYGYDHGWNRRFSASQRVSTNHLRQATSPPALDDDFASPWNVQFGSPHKKGTPVLWADGHVNLVSYSVPLDVWTAIWYWDDGSEDMEPYLQ